MAARKPAATAAGGEEERLLVEAARKDPAKFGDLYELHFERIYAFIRRRVHDRETAEDLTSEVFHKALANVGSYEWSGAPFAAWLIRIAANAIADRRKRDAREAPATEQDIDPGAQPDFVDLVDRPRLFGLVDELPAEQRRVIIGRFVDERSIREVAQELGKTEGAVKQLQLRALENLRARMEGSDA